MNTQSIFGQINECINNKSWRFPDVKQHEKDYKKVGELSDFGKTLFTLLKNGQEKIKTEQQRLKQLQKGVKNTSLNVESLFSVLQFTFTTINDKEFLSQEVVDTMVVEENLRQMLNEHKALGELLRGEVRRMIIDVDQYYGQYENYLMNDFVVYYKPIEKASKSENEEDNALFFELSVRKTLRVCDFIQLPADNPLISEYSALLEEFNKNNVDCHTGFVPRFATSDMKVIFMPKDIKVKGAYIDEKVDKSDPTALELRDRTESLLQQIRVSGTVYEHKSDAKFADV